MQSNSTPIIDRVPPHDTEAERCVLGSLMFSPDAFDDVMPIITATSFYSDSHRRIYAAMLSMFEVGITAIDVVTLRDKLTASKELDLIGGVQYLLQIMETVPHASHAEMYAKIVRDKSIQRDLIQASHSIQQDAFAGYLGSDEILANAERRIVEISEGGSQTTVESLEDHLVEFTDTINTAIQNRGNEDHFRGVYSGLGDLDLKIGRFRANQLIVVAARPGHGKTSFALMVAVGAAKAGHNTLFITIEMSRQEIMEQIVSIESTVPATSMRSGELDEVEQQAIADVIARRAMWRHMKIIDGDQITVREIASHVRRERRRNDIKMVFIDYLQLIVSEERGVNREQQVATISRRLKMLGKEVGIPVMLLAQLNREVTKRTDKRPMVSDLRESGSIEQDADVVLLLHRPEEYDANDSPGMAEVIIGKARKGKRGIVQCRFTASCTRFRDEHEPTEHAYYEESGGF